MVDRIETAKEWLRQVLSGDDFDLTLIPTDSIGKKYFRVRHRKHTLVLMDTQEKEKIDRYLIAAKVLYSARARVPAIYTSSTKLGFILMEDLGTNSLLDILLHDEQQANSLYSIALQELEKIRKADCKEVPNLESDFLMWEMNLFVDWYYSRHLNLEPTASEKLLFKNCFTRLIDNILGQPQVYTHRAYYLDNLVLLSKNNRLGVLGHQNFLRGPLTYDLACLLNNYSISWPTIMANNWIGEFYQAWLKETNAIEFSKQQIETWVDLTALQIHFKAAGLFARFAYRDGRQKPLEMLPVIMEHLTKVTARYPEFESVHSLLSRQQTSE